MKYYRTFTRQFWKGNILSFILGMVYALVVSGISVSVAWLLQALMDMIAGQNDYTMTQMLLAIAALLAVYELSYVLISVSIPRFRTRAMSQYKEYAYSELSRKSISAFSKESAALYTSALSNDTATIETGYVDNIFNIVENTLTFVLALAMMLWYSPLLTAVSISLAFLPLIGSVVTGNRLAKAEERVSDKNAAYMATLSDDLSGFSVIKSFRAEQAMCRLFAQKVYEAAEAKRLRDKASILMQAMSGTAGLLTQFGVFLVGAWMAVSGKGVTAGTVLAFIQLINYFVNPLTSLPQYYGEYKSAKALIRKLADALSENVHEGGMRIPGELNDAIELKNLDFSYDGVKNALSGINVRFQAGKRYAIVGGSGSGKSTILNLLMGSHVNYTGELLVDGVELKDIDPEALYSLISIVQQNVFVFNASIRDNITMFQPFPEEEVQRAIRLSGLSAFIEARGADCLCGENGSALSGGEKQRISIARCLLRKTPVLLVDEATAALDAHTARQVTEAILGLDGLTRIVVTHAMDGEVLSQYDEIIALKNGAIAETGHFNELIDRKGYFYSLFTVSQ